MTKLKMSDHPKTQITYKVHASSPFTGVEYNKPRVLMKIAGNTGTIDAEWLMNNIKKQLEASNSVGDVLEVSSE